MRILGRALRILVFIVTLIVTATTAAVIVTQTAWFKGWLRGYAVRQANHYLDAELSIGRLGGNLFSGIALEQVTLSMHGEQVVAIESMAVTYNIPEMIRNGVSIARISLTRPVVLLERNENGDYAFARLIKRRGDQTDRSGRGPRIALKAIEVADGTVTIRGPWPEGGLKAPRRFEHLDTRLAFTYQKGHQEIDIAQLSFRGAAPSFVVSAFSGSIIIDEARISLRKLMLRSADSDVAVDGGIQRTPTTVLELTIASEKLSLAEIAPLVRAVRDIPLEPSFQVKLSGPTSHLAIDMNVRSMAGVVSGALVADLAQPNQSVTGDVVLRNLDLAPILRNPDGKSDITGKASVKVHGAPLSDTDTLRWQVGLDAPHAAALGYVAEDVVVQAQVVGPRITFDARARGYDADATAVGYVVLKGDTRPLTYDLHGVARHVDLRRLPAHLRVPPALSDLNAAYQVSGSVQPGTGPNRQAVVASGLFEASTIAGMRIAPEATGGVTLTGSDVAYWGEGTIDELNLRRFGEGFGIMALQSERFEGLLNGHVTANGRGIGVREMTLTATGTLRDSAVLGMHVSSLAFDTSLMNNNLHVSAKGDVDDVDLKAAFGREGLEGHLDGSLDAHATLANISDGVTADSVEATGRVNLQRSNVGRIEIDRAAFDGDYSPASGVIRTLDVAGPVVSLQAHGTVALDESGDSNLIVHADTSSLEELGNLIDRPLAGMAVVDATVTGNKRLLTIAGHASGDGLKYGASGALELSTDYTARVPELRMKDVAVSATTRATFVTLGGQNINELSARTEYADRQLTFDATARQPNRSLNLAGEVTLNPDRQEVAVQRLAATTQGLSWQLAPGAQPVVRYGDDEIAVKDLRMRSGDQQLAIGGAFGRANDVLDVSLDNVDLAVVDAVMVRPPQLSGRLRASGSVTGTREQPQVRADFHVTQGGFRQFHYADLSGTMNYGGKGITLDAKLQQDASAWLTAKGYVPVALLKGPGNAPESHGAEVPPEDRIDLQIDSSPIQLGLIQGFTTAVSNVTGTMQANVQVTGSASDPHPGGSIAVSDAGFTVGASGVSYAGGSGRIEFQGDRVHIDEFRLLDNQRKALVVSGDLAIHERELGGVDVSVKATDFKVIDNKIGSVRINSNLHITGELSYPRVEGDLGINTGVINLDELLAATTGSAYSTTPIQMPGTDPASVERAGQPSASVFDALQMEIHVTVPNDLVVKGSDLRISDAPVGLGALNVTLGGDLWVSKTPWDRPRLTGPVNTVRGTYDFQGRRFDILRDGTLRFDGLDELEPVLDIRAERLIQGVRTSVNLRGTLHHPDVMLSSSPPLEQSDILALIVFNQPTSQIGAGQQISLAQRAESMALGAVVGQLASSIGGALDLNTFELQIAPDNGAAAQVTVGQQLSQNLFVKVEQGIGDQTATNVVIEYQLGKWLLLETNVRQGTTTLQPFQRVQGSGMDLIFFFSY
ncbi:MAG: translocation/assembly module TamB domain-containing protein [Acidobacteriota bacterium]